MDKMSAFGAWYEAFCAMKQCADKTSDEYRALVNKCTELKEAFNQLFEEEVSS